jgi:glutaredoxin
MKAAYPNSIKAITVALLLPLFLLFCPTAMSKPTPKEDSVVIFTTAWCPYCKRLREYLHSKHVQFTEYDIERSPVGKQKYEALSGRGVPVILICSQRLDGFDAGDVDRALEACGIH